MTAQLIRASTDTHLWAKEFDRNVSDMLQLQAEVAQAVAHEIQAQVTPEEARRLAQAVALDPAVQDAYLLGRRHLEQGGVENFKKAISYFEQVIKSKPDYAPAYASLSSARADLDNLIPQSEEAIRIPAEKAVKLDPELGEGHAVLAGARFNAWNWTEAEAEFQRAVELNPDSAFVCACYGVFLATVGKFREAFAVLDHGIKANPMSSEIHGNYALVAYLGRRYDDAIAHALRALELEPQNVVSVIVLARTYTRQGKFDDAIALLEKSVFRGSAFLAEAYASAGRKTEAWKIVNSITAPEAAHLPWGSPAHISHWVINTGVLNGSLDLSIVRKVL